MIKNIMKDGLFLQQPSIPATQADVAVGEDLRDTLAAHRERCVGMAANMIGVKKRIIIVNLGMLDLVMYNPVLLKKTGVYQTEEGCLSLTGTRVTNRYREITVRFFNDAWQEQTMTFTDFPAQIIQHELDHLEGILI